MSEEKLFTQAEVDEVVQKRLARQKPSAESAELEKRIEDLEAELEAAEGEAEKVKADWTNEKKQQAVEQALIQAGHTDSAKNQRILRNLDLANVGLDEHGEPVQTSVTHTLSKVEADLPELFSVGRRAQLEAMGANESDAPDYRTFKVGAGSHGSTKPVLDKPLTREDIERMSPEELKQPSVMERVDKFLSGQR